MPRETASPAILRHVDALYPPEDLDGLLEAQASVHALVGSFGWRVVQQILEAEIGAIDRKLDHAPGLSHVEYAKEHGRKGGIKAALEAAAAIIGRAEKRQAEQAAKHEADAESPAGR